MFVFPSSLLTCSPQLFACFGLTFNIRSTPVSSDRTLPVTLVLKDPQHPDQDLGTLELAVTLTPKHSPVEERRDSMVRAESSDCIDV